jgi:hypothetical protein
MTIFRSPMEKILKEQEDGEIITNPKEPVRTSYRKGAYRLQVWWDRLRRFFLGANDRRSDADDD